MHGAPGQSTATEPGLKAGAIGYVSSVVIGVASTAPGYSLAAVLGLIVAVDGIGVHAPAVIIASFVTIIVADIIVIANLAQIAGRYSFLLFDSAYVPSTALVTAVGVVWIAVMTWI